MVKLKVIKHILSVQYECEETKTKHSVKIENPTIREGSYFSDWHYKYVEIVCKSCGKTHKYEI